MNFSGKKYFECFKYTTVYCNTVVGRYNNTKNSTCKTMVMRALRVGTIDPKTSKSVLFSFRNDFN